MRLVRTMSAALLASLSLNAFALDNAEVYGILGAVVGNAVGAKSPRWQGVSTAVGGLAGYKYGERLDTLEEAKQRAIAEAAARRGITRCNTASSGRIGPDGQMMVANATFNCNGNQTLDGIRTAPVMMTSN